MCGSCQAPIRTSGSVLGPVISEFLGHHATEACDKLPIMPAECSELLIVRLGEKHQVTVWFLVSLANPRTCSSAVVFAAARLCRPFVDDVLWVRRGSEGVRGNGLQSKQVYGYHLDRNRLSATGRELILKPEEVYGYGA